MPPNGQRGAGSGTRSTADPMRSRPPSSAAPAPLPVKNPWFGIEIEIFVKVRDSVKKNIEEKLRNGKKVASHWEKWQWDLSNAEGNRDHRDKKEKQREYVGQAIMEILDKTLDRKHGWTCTADASLKEYKLELPPDPRKWWGIEIISPPLSSSSDWQAAIELVFKSITDTFNLWTNDFCACHVHVSQGLGKKAAYNLEQLIQIAKGAFYWEDALRQLLPAERRNNRYALANWRCFAMDEYMKVPQAGWLPVWRKIEYAGRPGTKEAQFAKRMTVAEGDPNANPRYRSTSFDPYESINTVELRRQAGVASAKTAIRRVLLALTLNVASLEFDFDVVGPSYPTAESLINELFYTLNRRLSGACQGAAFKTWLQDCHRNYTYDDMERRFNEVEINEREKNYRLYGQATNPNAAPRPSSAASNGRSVASGTTTTLPTRTAPSTTRNVIVVETQGGAYVPQTVNYSRQYTMDDVRYGGPSRDYSR
ncbi:uncharacterized protein B0H64DRAFT_444677 [Chaetomium fimeti]|uniref:Uncharacterized protein n=1 Tax=Chaetomium fimeti TaxID=1854472 RepID=A0AAE0HD53_9PEZI|nr:hypothetical protein B0H64DRAFT_444677 [Chaetomium fimeti]